MPSNWDASELDQRDLYRRLKVRKRAEPVKCPRCGTRNWVRREDKTCLGCAIRENRK